MAGKIPVRDGADLAQPRLRHHVPEARDGGEQARIPLPGRGLARGPLLEVSDGGVEDRNAILVQAA